MQFYELDDPNKYIGSLLISIDTQKIEENSVPYLNHPILSPIVEEDYWTSTNFQVNFAIIGTEAFQLKSNEITIKLEFGCKFANICGFYFENIH